MSIQAVGWALDQVDIPARPKLVLVSLANHADKVTGYCWLNAETIAQEAACKPRSVYRFIAALMHNGYVRREKKRGNDGKQRANDYWLLFNRQDAKWVELGAIEPEVEDAETHGSDETDIQDVDGENDARVTGTTVGQSAHDDSRQDDKKPALSCGPRDSGVSHKDSAEPSKTNPENVAPKARVPRGYRPPPPTPPQPMGATTLEGTGNLIFVFVGTPAYEAWKAVKERETGRSWNCKDIKNGRWGWHFPTLFPPQEKPPPSNAATALATENELTEFSKVG